LGTYAVDLQTRAHLCHHPQHKTSFAAQLGFDDSVVEGIST
jgi:hypothetical protein